MAPPLAKDIGKAASDLLTKEFPTKDKEFKVELRTKTSNGVEFFTTATSEGGAVTATFEESYNYKPYGVNLKGTLTSGGVFKTETSVTDQLLKNLKVIVNTEGKEKLTGGFEYKTDAVTANGNVAKTGEKFVFTGAAVFGWNKFLLGAQTSYPGLAPTGLLSYNGSDFTATVKAEKKSEKTTVTASYFHTVNSDLQVAAEAKIDDKATALSLVTALKLDKDTSVKARLETSGTLGLAYSQKLNDYAKLTIGTSLDVANGGAHKYNFNLALNN